MGRNQYVVRNGDSWGVRGEGNEKLTSKHETQKEAKAAGREIAKNQKSELLIQGREGKFVAKESYGNDPCPPKDNEH